MKFMFQTTKQVGGFSPPLWKIMEFVTWDGFSIPNCFWKVNHKIPMVPVTSNQGFFRKLPSGYLT